MNKYFKIDYASDFVAETQTQYVEIGPDGYALRNLEEFRTGGYGFADSEGRESNGVLLPEGKTLAEDITSSDGEFETTEISREAFETLWNRYAKLKS